MLDMFINCFFFFLSFLSPVSNILHVCGKFFNCPLYLHSFTAVLRKAWILRNTESVLVMHQFLVTCRLFFNCSPVSCSCCFNFEVFFSLDGGGDGKGMARWRTKERTEVKGEILNT